MRRSVFGNALTVPNYKVAVKTGTTQEFRDGWTAGYTPNLATVVWVGNNDNTKMKPGADGSVVPPRSLETIWRKRFPNYQETNSKNQAVFRK